MMKQAKQRAAVRTGSDRRKQGISEKQLERALRAEAKASEDCEVAEAALHRGEVKARQAFVRSLETLERRRKDAEQAVAHFLTAGGDRKEPPRILQTLLRKSQARLEAAARKEETELRSAIRATTREAKRSTERIVADLERMKKEDEALKREMDARVGKTSRRIATKTGRRPAARKRASSGPKGR